MSTKPNKKLRYILRGLSGLIIVFSLFMFIGETFLDEKTAGPLTNNAILQLSIAGIGLTGLGIAWKWELTGGIIALVAYFVLAIINYSVLGFPLVYLWPITAILFIALWVISTSTTDKQH
jgi:hypothetical protein